MTEQTPEPADEPYRVENDIEVSDDPVDGGEAAQNNDPAGLRGPEQAEPPADNES